MSIPQPQPRTADFAPTANRTLARALITVSEEERRRIGAELHDGVGQQLTGIACLATALKEELRAAGSKLAAQADQIARHINDAIELTRAQARGLFPVQVMECGVYAALEDLTNQVERMHGVSCLFEISGPPEALDPAAALNLYRIAQEAINNAVRHGGADRIVLRLESTGSCGKLSIEDNGRGFRLSEHAQGLGLRLMAHRASLMRGSIRISSRPGAGTRVDCTFPHRGS